MANVALFRAGKTPQYLTKHLHVVLAALQRGPQTVEMLTETIQLSASALQMAVVRLRQSGHTIVCTTLKHIGQVEYRLLSKDAA